jgi:hypothetical protein
VTAYLVPLLGLTLLSRDLSSLVWTVMLRVEFGCLETTLYALVAHLCVLVAKAVSRLVRV